MKDSKVESAKIRDKREREKQVVALMIAIYCKKVHKNKRAMTGELCAECAALNDYAKMRSDKCPFMEQKTFCSNCRVHCYGKAERERIRAVMRFSGSRMIFYHPIMAIKHMTLMIKERQKMHTQT